MVYEHIIRSGSLLKVFEKAVTSAANAGAVTLATITNESLIIDSVIIYAAAAQTANLTSCAITGGTAGAVTFIDALTALGTTLSADDKQISWTGAVRLTPTETIVMTLVGTGAAATNMVVAITYHSTKSGGYLQ